MKSFSFLFLFLVLLHSTAPAAPLERDLGQGLTYYRVHRLPADLPASDPAAKKPRAIVLDLRYTESAQAGADALDAWLKRHAGSANPVILLVNQATAPLLTQALANRETAAGLVAIGTPSDNFIPDIAIAASAEAERTAYDALDHGTTVDALISDNPEKPRHDEAELAQQHRAPPPAADDTDGPEPAPAEKKTPPPPPVTDRVLQRAVHLHRALLALRKLPPG
jgi:hypothetical protein